MPRDGWRLLLGSNHVRVVRCARPVDRVQALLSSQPRNHASTLLTARHVRPRLGLAVQRVAGLLVLNQAEPMHSVRADAVSEHRVDGCRVAAERGELRDPSLDERAPVLGVVGIVGRQMPPGA